MHKNRIKSSFAAWNILLLIVFLIVTVWFSLSTKFVPGFDAKDGHDAGIFAYIGWSMDRGRILYTQTWENKGPLLYFINMLGVRINYWNGIYFLEFISLFVTSLFLYKSASLFFNRFVALFSAIYAMCHLAFTLQGGNLSEEYALPFVAVSLYLIAKFLKQGLVLKRTEMMAVGIAICGVFLLRANILAFQGCLVLLVIIELIRSKEWKKLVQVTLFAFLGFLLFLTPFLIYLIKNDALENCINSAYLGILSSYSGLPMAERAKNVLKMIVDFSGSGLYLVIAVSFFTFFFKKICKTNVYVNTEDKMLNSILCTSWVAIFVNIFANSLSGVYHMHYFMTFIPIILFPIAWILNICYNYVLGKICKYKIIGKKVILCFVVLMVSFSIVYNLLTSVVGCVLYNINGNNDVEYEEIAKFVLDHSAPDEMVQTFGNKTATLNYKTQRLSASRYSYYANGFFGDLAKQKFANEIAEDVFKNNPRLIIIDDVEKYKDFIAHLKNSDDWGNMIIQKYEKPEIMYDYVIYKLK